MTQSIFHDTFAAALDTVADDIRRHLPPHVFDTVSAETVHTICRQRGISKAQLGQILLPLAAAFAVTPVSNFNVGAVAFDSEGNAYLGANFEFADTHIAQAVHAEQSAIANAWQRGASDLALLAINYPPCGHCRQFINEVNLTEDFRIQLPDCQAQPLSYYLPDAFGPADLGIDERILGNPHSTEQTAPHNVGKNSINNTHVDALLDAAHQAYLQAHAPYSQSRSGVALMYADSEIVTGCYAENAAFNPTLPPLQMALNTRRLQGKDWTSVTRAVMQESPTTLSQRDNTTALLATWGVSLDYFRKGKNNE